MKISEKECDRLMCTSKTKEDLLKFDNDAVSEAEAHELSGSTSINSKGNVLKHRTKIRKETFNWSQLSAMILFYLHPFFGGKEISLVRYIYEFTKGH